MSNSSPASDSPITATSTAREPSTTPWSQPSFFQQQPPAPSLFASLLLNREQVYESRSSSLAPRPIEKTTLAEKQTVKWTTRDPEDDAKPSTSDPHEHEGRYDPSNRTGIQNVLAHSNNAMVAAKKTATVSKKRGRPAKKTPAKKSKGMAEDRKPKKRPALSVLGSRVSKRQQTEANSGKKVDTKGKFVLTPGSASTRTPPANVKVIYISSDEGEMDSDHKDVEPPIVSKRALVKHEQAQITEPDTKGVFASTVKFDSPDNESDLLPGSSGEYLQHLQYESTPIVETEHAQELQQLRQQLEAANAETEAVKAETERVHQLAQREKNGVELTHVRLTNPAKRKHAILQQKLKTEREVMRVVVQDRDQLRIDLDSSRTRIAELARELEEQKRLRERDSEDHEVILNDIMRSNECKQTLGDHLQQENMRLRTENENLHAAAISRSQSQSQSSASNSTLSPAPSSFSPSDEEKKVENIRKTYTKVKRRFDNLHSVAVNLATCTKSMNLSAFGEFGTYVRQLKTALEEDGMERSGVGMNVSMGRSAAENDCK
ncbi:hypothetical protein EJ02DRAFT_450556 [Clathrospora elynae]|uniref:Uncharacterized protein n=1 Tax=Clathrospora elynae TaxID=706981 RepID=A0A6A5T0F7_9PLEO|nr:hypothetical protein EJ02DRAFT_450556 [Clathrospora elynae]